MPPEARTADSTDTVTIVPRPGAPRRRPPGLTGVAVRRAPGGAQAGDGRVPQGRSGRGAPCAGRTARARSAGPRPPRTWRTDRRRPPPAPCRRGSATGSGRRVRPSAPMPSGHRAADRGSARSGAPRRAACRRADRVRRRPGERPPRDRRSWLRGSSLWLRGGAAVGAAGGRDQGCRTGIHRRALRWVKIRLPLRPRRVASPPASRRIRARSRGSRGSRTTNRDPTPDPALDLDRPVVHVDDRLHDREAEARARAAGLVAPGAAVEAVEDQRQLGLRRCPRPCRRPRSGRRRRASRPRARRRSVACSVNLTALPTRFETIWPTPRRIVADPERPVGEVGRQPGCPCARPRAAAARRRTRSSPARRPAAGRAGRAPSPASRARAGSGPASRAGRAGRRTSRGTRSAPPSRGRPGPGAAR